MGSSINPLYTVVHINGRPGPGREPTMLAEAALYESRSNDDGFQVVRSNGDRARALVAVIAIRERDEIAKESLAIFCGEGVKRSQRRAVMGPEERHVFFCRSKAEDC